MAALVVLGGSIRFNTPMLFAVSFLPMFGIGGLTGLPLGEHLGHPAARHYYDYRSLPYVVAPGRSSRCSPGSITGIRGDRPEDERDARPRLVRLARLHERRVHADVHRGAGRCFRRLFDAGSAYDFARGPCRRNVVWGAWIMLPFIFNFWSIWNGEGHGKYGRPRPSSGPAPSPPPPHLRRRAAGVSRSLRIQRARSRQGLPPQFGPDTKWTFHTP